MSALDRALRVTAKTLRRLPPSALRLLGGKPRKNDRGTVLSPHTQVLLAIATRTGHGMSHDDVATARETNERSAGIAVKTTREAVEVEPLDLPSGVPARIYRTRGARGPAPMMVWFHGGGWVIGNLNTADPFCRRACAETGAIIVSVDYRLAPEHPWPAGLDDTLAAFRDVIQLAPELGGDPERVGIGGDSAGGNLSAIACRRLRDEGGPMPSFQLLVYPATDLRKTFPSFRIFAKGFMLTAESIDWFLELTAADPNHIDASPLLATDLSNLPPAIVVTAGFDPLRDEGEAYAARLKEAGVPVDHLDADNLIHGFIQMDGAVPAADAAVTELLRRTRQYTSPPP